MGYREVYAGWKADPEAFWMNAAQDIDWVRSDAGLGRQLRSFTNGSPMPRSTPAGTQWTGMSRQGVAIRIAIIHDSPVTRSKHAITYRELQQRVALLAGALRAKGVEKGDRVIIYMPMVPEALRRCWPARGLGPFTRWCVRRLCGG